MKKALILSGGGARGAFQIGVWKYLQEKNWIPDIICGTSIGAINAAGIGSGLGIQELSEIWTTHNHRKIYKTKLISFLAHLLIRQDFTPMLDIAPMKAMLNKYLDFNTLKTNEIKIIISAVNVFSARPEFFNNKEIKLEHIIASSAMPIIFPWQLINGQPYWDGGVMANTPLFPALSQDVDEIIVVMLSPVGNAPQSKPDTVLNAGEHVCEHFLSASYQTTMLSHGLHEHNKTGLDAHTTQYRNINSTSKNIPKIITIAPSRMLGFKSFLNFSLKQAKDLIDEGYEKAQYQLSNYI